MNIFTKSTFLTASGFLYWDKRLSYLLFTWDKGKITVSCFFCFDGDMLMFDCGMLIFLFGFELYYTKEESKLAFCLRTGCGVMFLSSSKRDYRI
jgi:hypothetical protein